MKIQRTDKEKTKKTSAFFGGKNAPFFSPIKKQLKAPAIQKSAKAEFEDADFEDRSDVVRKDFEKNLPPDNWWHRMWNTRKRKRRKFEERIELLNPEKYEQQKANLEKTYTGGKLKRKLKRLEKQRKKAAKKIGPIPQFGRILVIESMYHYVEEQTLPNGVTYRFSDEVLNTVKEKFKVGNVWTDLDWQGENIGVRFDITFKKHSDPKDVAAIEDRTIGESRMVGKDKRKGSGADVYDFTQDPHSLPAEDKDKLADAYHSEIAIDTEGIRNESHEFRYYDTESDRTSGQAPKRETSRPKGEQLKNYMASVICHEIGHNIGMIHEDKGIMGDQSLNVRFRQTEVSTDGAIDTSSTSTGTSQGGTDMEYSVHFGYPNNPITKENIQQLLDRIPDMSKKQFMYWQEELDAGRQSDEKLRDSGFVVLGENDTQ